jgi:hypothetical protein
MDHNPKKVQLEKEVREVIRVVHKRVIRRRHQEAGGNVKDEEGKNKPVDSGALWVMYVKVMKDETLSSNEVDSGDEMRKDVDSLIVKIEPTLKAQTYGIRSLAIATNYKVVVLVPRWKIIKGTEEGPTRFTMSIWLPSVERRWDAVSAISVHPPAGERCHI